MVNDKYVSMIREERRQNRKRERKNKRVGFTLFFFFSLSLYKVEKKDDKFFITFYNAIDRNFLFLILK